MKNLKKLIYAAALICIANYSFAQTKLADDDRISDKKIQLSISFLPLYLYSNATKLDAELQFKDSKHGFIVSSEIYNGLTTDASSQLFNSDSRIRDNIEGLGLGIAYKYKFNKEGNTGIYLSPGFIYRKTTITAESETFYPYYENDLLYYTYGDVAQDYKLNNILLSAVMGYQKVWTFGVLLDFHIGAGYKAASKNESLNKIRNYTEYPYNYGFTGPVLLLGVKIGFQVL